MKQGGDGGGADAFPCAWQDQGRLGGIALTAPSSRRVQRFRCPRRRPTPDARDPTGPLRDAWPPGPCLSAALASTRPRPAGQRRGCEARTAAVQRPPLPDSAAPRAPPSDAGLETGSRRGPCRGGCGKLGRGASPSQAKADK